MPEGPELHLASLFVNRVCAGLLFKGKVEKSEVSKNAEVPFKCPEYTISAVSRGKELNMILTPVSDATKVANIIFRFGLSGRFKFTSEDEIPKHAHLRFYTKDVPKQVLSFVDPLRFGTWTYNGKWKPQRGPCVIKEYELFRENILNNLSNKAFDKPICEAMLNQKYFNGIGNYLRAEILFRLKIPPFIQARVVLKSLENLNQNTELTPCKKIKVKKENPDLLQLCHLVSLEVVNLGGNKRKKDFYAVFEKWMQCYNVPGMKSLRDNTGRTIWFQGEPGPLAPKLTKVKMKSKPGNKGLKKTIKLEKTASKGNAGNGKATAIKKGRTKEVKVEPTEEFVAIRRKTKTKNVSGGKTKRRSEQTNRVQKVTEGKMNRRSAHRNSTLNTRSRSDTSALQQSKDAVTPKPRRRQPRANMSLQPHSSPRLRPRTSEILYKY